MRTEIRCRYQSPAPHRGMFSCSLGKFGGFPYIGNCMQCPDRADSALTAVAQASVRFARSGFAATPPDILAEREAACRACPEWDAAALNSTGRCRKCGCSTWAKLRMATERCPLGKWGAFDTPPTS